MNDKQCATGRRIKQIGSEAEKCGINWQVYGNLDSKGGIYNQWMEKKRLFFKWYWGNWLPNWGENWSLPCINKNSKRMKTTNIKY